MNYQVANETSPFYGIPDNAKSLLEEPSKVLQLKNVVCFSLISSLKFIVIQQTVYGFCNFPSTVVFFSNAQYCCLFVDPHTQINKQIDSILGLLYDPVIDRTMR